MTFYTSISGERDKRLPILFRVLAFLTGGGQPCCSLACRRHITIQLRRFPLRSGLFTLGLATCLDVGAFFAQTLLRPAIFPHLPEAHYRWLELYPPACRDAKHTGQSGVVIGQRAVGGAPGNHHEL